MEEINSRLFLLYVAVGYFEVDQAPKKTNTPRAHTNIHPPYKKKSQSQEELAEGYTHFHHLPPFKCPGLWHGVSLPTSGVLCFYGRRFVA